MTRLRNHLARRRVLALVLFLGLVPLAVGAYLVLRRPASMLAFAKAHVPSSSAHFAFRGTGFAGPAVGPVISDVEPLANAPASRTLTAIAPQWADGTFDIGSLGSRNRAAVQLVGAAHTAIELDAGIAVYRDIYPGVTVASVRDPEQVELLYIVDDARRAPDLTFTVAPSDEASELVPEPTTGGLLIRTGDGRPILRIAPPTALDGSGIKRQGSYELHDGQVRIAMRWEGLRGPVVVDPAFIIPFWSVNANDKVPGGIIYDPTTSSREAHLAMDVTRNRAVLVRPVRRQQPEDTVFLFGDVSRSQNESYQRIAAVPRVPGDGGPTMGPEELEEWSRGFATESETWEWSGTEWSQIATARLPGLIDPALAYDPKRARTVLYGGGSPGFHCRRVSKFLFLNQSTLISCDNPDSQAVTYEYAGGAWTAMRIAGSPPPRLRAAMVWDAALGRIVLFGGRELKIGNKAVDPYGSPFPDNLAMGLLNDTWTYDGTTWDRVATGNPPPPREGAQLIYDAARKVVVLVGGITANEVAPHTDRLSIWEFDGIDWSERLHPASASLSPSLRTRRGAAAFWNPIRQRVTLFGGTVERFDGCTLSETEIQEQIAATAEDPVARDALAASGCLGGYVHDLWEWDGDSLSRARDAAWGGYVGSEPIFRQLSGATPWAEGGAAPAADGGISSDAPPTSLLPWRYDPSPTHFEPRSALERAHLPDAGPPINENDDQSALDGGAPSNSSPDAFPVSPLFASRIRPEVAFDTNRQVLTIFTPGDGAAYETDGEAWVDRTPKTSPFSQGTNDFFAATWDSRQQRIVLFDPRTAATWVRTDADGWFQLSPSASPPVWGVDPAVRSLSDLRPADKVHRSRDLDHQTGLAARTFETAALHMPRLVFDRARSRVVMLYEGSTWEFDGSSWSQGALPPGLANCSAAILVGFDGARSRTVAFGCRIPAETWEWDGATWVGPGSSPYQARIPRDHSYTPYAGDDLMDTWSGTFQLAWSHPNAAFESPALGGVSTLDADGTLRTWTGSAWTAGPKIADANHCFSTGMVRKEPVKYAFPIRLDMLLGRDYVPLCTFPPIIEDAAHGRILALRDGPRGMLALNLQGVPPEQRAWAPLMLGNPSPDEGFAADAVHPYPLELLSPEHIYLTTRTDPVTREFPAGLPTPALPRDSWRVSERTFQGLWWPFVLLDDPLAKRTRFLTHRGVLWELGGEVRQGLGESCQSQLDCAVGSCTIEHVCCDKPWCGAKLCSTCRGTTPGVCEWVPAGDPDPRGRCGSGECAGSCPGGPAPSACAFAPDRACGAAPVCDKGVLTPSGHCSPSDPTCILADTVGLPICPIINGQPDLSTACRPAVAPCPGGLGCADATSCKGTCSSRLDCLSRYQSCDAQGRCAPDTASLAASAQGVTPVLWTPPRLRSPEEIAAILTDAGVETDDAGRILFSHVSIGGVIPVFDPKIRTPITGIRLCFDYIHTCMSVTQQIDACVASAARCVTDKPWLGDPAGDDCCPENCLATYFQTRTTSNELSALNSILTSGCYPGDESMLDGGAP